MKEQQSNAALARESMPLTADEFAIRERAKFEPDPKSSIKVTDDGVVTLTMVFRIVDAADNLRNKEGELLPWPGGVFKRTEQDHFEDGVVKKLRLSTSVNKIFLQSDSNSKDINLKTTAEKRESGIGLVTPKTSQNGLKKKRR